MPIINDVAIKNQIDNELPDSTNRGITGNVIATVLKGLVDWVKNEVVGIIPANFQRTYSIISATSGTITGNGADQIINFISTGSKTASLSGSFTTGTILTIVNSSSVGDITISLQAVAGGYANPVNFTIRPANAGSSFETLVTVFKCNVNILKTVAGWSLI
jgi:hypothetical protein